MTQSATALLASFIYVFAAIGAAEGLRAWRGYSVDFTRKFIHVAVGMWAYGTVLLFERRTFAIIPPLAFVVINALSHWRGTFKAMETGERWKLGTVYFPLAFAGVIWFLWRRPELLIAALMPMTWGDALAAVVGRRAGKRRYTILGSTRSLEGSAVMLLASWLATFVPLALTGYIDLGTVVWVSAVTALGATAVEAVSPWGIDNLTVPAVSAAILILALPIP